jgi:hypothetical protein
MFALDGLEGFAGSAAGGNVATSGGISVGAVSRTGDDLGCDGVRIEEDVGDIFGPSVVVGFGAHSLF